MAENKRRFTDGDALRRASSGLSAREPKRGDVQPPSPPHCADPASLEPHRREIAHLQALLERTQAELREAKARLEMHERGASGSHHPERIQAQLYGEVGDLRDKLRFSELQLSASREEGEGLARQIHELRAVLSEAQARVAEIAAFRVQATNCARAEAAAREQLKEEARRNQELARNFDHANREHNGQISRLREEHRRMSKAAQESEQALSDATARADAQVRTNADMAEQLVMMKEQLKTAHVARRADVHAMAALHQLQLDNQRLVRLLASTAEYRQFIALSDESGGLAYMPPDPTTGEDAAKTRLPKSSGRDRKVQVSTREAAFWVPADAYALVSDFRHRYVPAVPMSQFHGLLLKLSKVWKRRETARLDRIREAHASKVSELRRRLSQQVPYDEVVTSSEVERLRRELRAARAEAATGGRRLNMSEQDLLESTLTAVDGRDRQLRQVMRANDELRLELAEQARAVHAAFGDGAQAASEVASAKADELVRGLHELMREFQARTMGLARSDADLFNKVIRLQSWFLDTAGRRLADGRERLASVHDVAPLANEANPAAPRCYHPPVASTSSYTQRSAQAGCCQHGFRPPPHESQSEAWAACTAFDVQSDSEYGDYEGERGAQSG
jgi:hypothetical protein